MLLSHIRLTSFCATLGAQSVKRKAARDLSRDVYVRAESKCGGIEKQIKTKSKKEKSHYDGYCTDAEWSSRLDWQQVNDHK